METEVLAGYAAVVALGIAWHEPWADEAQAWLLARDQGWWHLMAHAMRYEGSPGLWHSLLWVLIRLHVSFVGMHWVSGAIAAAGVLVLLRYAPFPLILRILFPFGFWLAYQNAVVARSYVLFAVLAFSAAALLRSMARDEVAADRRKLVGLAVLLGLMANLSLHGFVASLGFAIVALAILRRRARAGTPTRKAMPALVLCCFWVIAVATTVPPSDVSFAAGKNLERSTEKVWASLGDQEAKAQLAADQSTTSDVRPGELAPVPSVVVHRTMLGYLWHKVSRCLSLLTYPMSTFRWLALATCLLVVAQAVAFHRSPGELGWIGLIPWALMVLFFLSMYLAPRHAGMIWVTFVATLWLTWPAENAATGQHFRLRQATLAALVLVACDQAWWTAHAVWSDMHQPYCGDVAMAQFLAAQGPGKRIAGFNYHSIGIEVWFDHQVYFNQPHAYWVWSRRQRVSPAAPATIATHPDVLVVGGFDTSSHNGTVTDDWVTPNPAELNRIPLDDEYGILAYAEAHGYRETHRFCGHAFMRDGYSELLCQVALEPVR